MRKILEPKYVSHDVIPAGEIITSETMTRVLSFMADLTTNTGERIVFFTTRDNLDLKGGIIKC